MKIRYEIADVMKTHSFKIDLVSSYLDFGDYDNPV